MPRYLKTTRSTPLPTFSSEDIRRLRGAMSRPRFGALVGVSGNTVYRWELPVGASNRVIPSEAARRMLTRILEDQSIQPGAAAATAHAGDEQPVELAPPPVSSFFEEGTLPVSAIERLSRPMPGRAQVIAELCDVLRSLAPGAVVAVSTMDGELVSGEASVHNAAGVRFESFGGTRGPRYRLAMKGALPVVPVRALLRVVDMALDVAPVEELRRPAPEIVQSLPSGEEFIVGSPVMRDLMAAVRRLGPCRATVLVQGESGSGKELIARALHEASERAGRLVPFNCAATPAALFESQLFGHVRGAFTGADREAMGAVRAANGGTLFLDEVGELPLDVQPKLLRFLEGGEVHPVGASRPERVDVRVVAATNRDLALAVREGRFREDLFYRLHVVPLRVPPLRERPEEIPLIVAHFLHRLCGRAAPRLADDALAALRAYHWPGNVRQLRNELERIVALHGTAQPITMDLLSPEVLGHGPRVMRPAFSL